MEKNDYLRLKERYLEALATPEEIRALQEYIVKTDDPDFDDVKAIFSFFALGRQVHGTVPSRKHPLRPLMVTAIAASLLLFVFAGIRLAYRHDTPAPTATSRNADILAMESTLTEIFTYERTDIDLQMNQLFTP